MPRKIVCFANVRKNITEDVNQIILLRINWLAEHTDYVCYLIVSDVQMAETDLEAQLSSKVHLIVINEENFRLSGEMCFGWSFNHWNKRRRYRKELNTVLGKLKPDAIWCTLDNLDDFFYVYKKRKCIHVFELCAGDKAFFYSECDESCNMGFAEFVRISIKRDWIIKKMSRMQVPVTSTKGLAKEWEMYLNRACNVIHLPLLEYPANPSPSQEPQVMAVGDYDNTEVLKDLLMAWKRIAECYPEWRLRLYGSGNIVHCRMLIKKLKINRSASCHMKPRSLKDVYSQYAIYLQWTGCEVGDRYLLEAMSYGLPTLVFAPSNLPTEFVDDGKTGFSSPVNHQMDFSGKLGIVIRKEELRKELGMNAYKAALNYTVDDTMKDWKALFDQIFANSSERTKHIE